MQNSQKFGIVHWTVVSIADILQRNLLLKISGNFFVCLLLQAVLDYCITNCWNTCQIPQNSKIINKEKYSHHATHLLKVAFFQRVQWIFFRSPNLRKKYSKKLYRRGSAALLSMSSCTYLFTKGPDGSSKAWSFNFQNQFSWWEMYHILIFFFLYRYTYNNFTQQQSNVCT